MSHSSIDLTLLIHLYHSFNQVTVSYDASKEEKLEALEQKQTEVKERLRDQ